MVSIGLPMKVYPADSSENCGHRFELRVFLDPVLQFGMIGANLLI